MTRTELTKARLSVADLKSDLAAARAELESWQSAERAGEIEEARASKDAALRAAIAATWRILGSRRGAAGDDRGAATLYRSAELTETVLWSQ